MSPIVIRVVARTAKVKAQPVHRVAVTSGGGPRVIVVPARGLTGPQGPPGEGTRITGEAPSGAIDGINTTFTTAHPYRAASTAVYLNGLRELDYAESGDSTITFGEPPISSDVVAIDYAID